MLIEVDYRGHRIEVNAFGEGERWNADVMIRRTLSSDNPRPRELLQAHREHAERAAMIWAQRWIDLQLNDGSEPARQ